MKKRFFTLAWLILLPSFCFADLPQSLVDKKPKAPAPQPINCQYKMAKDSDTVEQAVISTWAEHAAVQSFQFNPDKLQDEMDALKPCYTSQGWKAFNEALKTSGNLDAIRSNNLTVTSRVSGSTNVKIVKEKQWKVSVPLKVTYQNKEKELKQILNVELLIALNKSGSFGIMQVIAVPKEENKKT